MVKPLAIGTVGGIAAPYVPVLKTLPYSSAIGGIALNYLMGGKNIKSMAIAGAGGYFVAPMVNKSMGSGSGYSVY